MCFLHPSYAQDDKYDYYRAIYSNTILTDGQIGQYAEHGAWEKVNFLINLGDSMQLVIPKTPEEIYKLKKDSVYRDDFDDIWIRFKCWDAGKNEGRIRIESYNVAKPLHWGGETIIAAIYIDFPNITYVYKLKGNL